MEEKMKTDNKLIEFLDDEVKNSRKYLKDKLEDNTQKMLNKLTKNLKLKIST
jgi:hypothetical protein